MLMGGGSDPNDPSRLAKTLTDLFTKGIDTGRAMRDEKAIHEGQAAFGAGFKQGHDEGKRQATEKMAIMADELLTFRQEHGKGLCKPLKRAKTGHSRKK